MKILLSALLVLFLTVHSASGDTGDTTAPCRYADTMKIASCANATLLSIDTSASGCTIAKYLRHYMPYIEEKSTSCSLSVSLMNKRLESLGDPHAFPIDNSTIQWLGDAAAPVSVIMYVSMSCPHCKQVYKQLYDTLHIERSLMKHLRLGLKYRSDTKFDKILAATAQFGKQPAFMRRCGDISVRIDDNEVKKIAAMISIPYDSLEEAAYKPETILNVKISKQEAVDNGVEFTPAIFINGYRYTSTKTPEWIIDAALYRETTIAKSKKR